jgi:predicted esterase
MQAPSPRMRLLCLHGNGTSGTILERQLYPLSKACPEVELIFLDGAHKTQAFNELVAKVFGAAEHYRYMERRKRADGSGDEYCGIAEAVAYAEAAYKEHGCQGVLGFSQGANLATMLCAHLEEKPQMCVAFCGTQFGWQQQEECADWFGAPLSVPSLHVVGRQDSIAATSVKLSTLFKEPQLMYHESDHRPFPPSPAEAEPLAQAVRSFILSVP